MYVIINQIHERKDPYIFVTEINKNEVKTGTLNNAIIMDTLVSAEDLLGFIEFYQDEEYYDTFKIVEITMKDIK